MLKSVFAKYVTTFTVLLMVTFLLLLFIVDSVMTNHSLRAEQAGVGGVAAACAEHLSEMYGEGDGEAFGDFIRGEGAADPGQTPSAEPVDGEVERVLRAILTNSDDMTVFVTDVHGGFIFSMGKYGDRAPAVGTPLLRESDLSALLGQAAETEAPSAGFSLRTEGETTPETLAVDGGMFLGAEALPDVGQPIAYATPVMDGEVPVGIVVVTSTAESSSYMMKTTIRSVAVAALWILLAAFIAIYFTTERVIGPLREMSRASKKLMVGQFDVRVRVHGKDEVAELAMAFNSMAEALGNLNAMRNSFVANVSHDLRTPMTTISGFIDGILDGVIPPEQHSHYLRVVSDEVRRLSRLVTALLDVSRLQAGDRKFDMKPFDVCEMGRQILISFEKKIDDKHLDVSFDCDEDRMFVLADRDAIHQILYNICDNAVKFASEGGKLSMSFTWTEGDTPRSRKALVQVFNEGQGIPPEDIPFVFERFYKSDKSRSLDKTGVGLGMFIAKTIIEAHKETIRVASDYGRNCTFSFTLAETEPPSPRAAEGTRRNP